MQWIPAWLPGGRWKMRAAEVRQMVRRTSDVPFARVQAAIVSNFTLSPTPAIPHMCCLKAVGTARPCFLRSLLEEEGETSGEGLEEIKAAANLVYGGECPSVGTASAVDFNARAQRERIRYALRVDVTRVHSIYNLCPSGSLVDNHRAQRVRARDGPPPRRVQEGPGRDRPRRR